jgi:hypothetical protein
MHSALVDAARADRALGFSRDEHGVEDLPGTATEHDVHVFVISELAPDAWPAKWEETAGLPSTLTAALKARKADLKVRVKLTAATLLAGAGDATGDVLIYPSGLRVRNCSAGDADALIDLLNGVPASRLAVAPVGPTADAVFLCAHTNRDKRCGLIGPALAEVFAEELGAVRRADVPIRMCSHIGGHKWAGNAIVYTAAEGHWYGYCDPSAAAEIVREHIVGGKPLIRSKLWRGQSGLSEDEMRAKCEACAAKCG